MAPVAKLQSWVVESIGFERTHTWAMCSVLEERGHGAAAKLAQRLLVKVFHDADDHMRRRAEFYHIVLPPPIPPPPAPAQLPAHLQYAQDAADDGRTEQVPFEQRILSVEWRQAHPSIGIQQEFAIMAKKRAWDKAMGELLNARKTWDLPPETTASPKESGIEEEL